MTDISNQQEAQRFFKEQMSEFFAFYAKHIQDNMKSEWDIDIEHRQCWDIVYKIVMSKFGDSELDVRKFRLLQAQIIDETVHDIRDTIIAKYSKLNTIH